MTGDKYEKPLFIEMDFEEAIERFGRTDPKEVKESIERAKEKQPPEPNAPATTKTRRKATPSGRP